MAALRISLFGIVRVFRNDQASELRMAPSVEALLAYLLLQRHRYHPRDVLASLFWGSHRQEQARNCLNTALWRLRSMLEPEGTPRGAYLLTLHTGEVGFNRESDYWLDVAAFEEKANQALAQPAGCLTPVQAQELEQVLPLYIGDLLESFYDDWALRERERLRALYLKSMACLMQYYRHCNEYDRSLHYAQAILYQDPLREDIHREVIRLHLENGDRALALQQYEVCCQILARELHVGPMDETRSLYTEMMSRSPRVAADAEPDPSSLQQALARLRMDLRRIEEVRDDLHRAIQAFEPLVDDRAEDGSPRLHR